MREIKFRGKRVDNGDWIYGTPVTYRDGYVAIYDGLLMLYGSEATTLSRHKVDPATVGQLTGLQDSKGVDIYEGDVVVHPCGYCGDYKAKSGVQVVEWNVEHNESGFWIGDLPDDCAWNDCEVIGNIHDNPELIK